jgi:hypothetical protein
MLVGTVGVPAAQEEGEVVAEVAPPASVLAVLATGLVTGEAPHMPTMAAAAAPPMLLQPLPLVLPTAVKDRKLETEGDPSTKQK